MGVDGQWQEVANDERGIKYHYHDADGRIRGYVFTKDYCQERGDMDRALSELMTGVGA